MLAAPNKSAFLRLHRSWWQAKGDQLTQIIA